MNGSVGQLAARRINRLRSLDTSDVRSAARAYLESKANELRLICGANSCLDS